MHIKKCAFDYNFHCKFYTHIELSTLGLSTFIKHSSTGVQCQ